MSYNGILEIEPFDCWGIDFIGPFSSSYSHLYILEGLSFTSRVGTQSLSGYQGPKFDQTLAGKKRLLKLNELEEMRLRAYENALIYKERTKRYHEKHLVSREFNAGQLYNSRFNLFSGKLKSKWSGPFVIKILSPHGAMELMTSEGDRIFKVNGQRIKPYLGGELPNERVGLVLTDL
ncbi:hypothetical protein MTR_7g015160 [Medicago truncatula]|uniref:Reverse transcriptase domain-containing protein n=1 Tax=Medicago truncatula TaxID=3880 RepID=A0A072TWX1_MEDTR|nr:hypothetical protein MTR_7g015160 [Medicago truncatula]